MASSWRKGGQAPSNSSNVNALVSSGKGERIDAGLCMQEKVSGCRELSDTEGGMMGLGRRGSSSGNFRALLQEHLTLSLAVLSIVSHSS